MSGSTRTAERERRSAAVVTCRVAIARAMGCRAELTVAACPNRVDRLVAAGVWRLRHLESVWSRFRPDSDISRLGRAGGRPVTVDPATIELVRAMAEAVRLTDGAFDPTLLGAMVGLGYGPAWDRGDRRSAVGPARERVDWIGAASIDPIASTITLPAGVCLDPGALGKGRAADVVATELIAAGASEACVVVGGDVRTTATTVVGVAGPHSSRSIVDRIAVGSAGIATSGVGRTWIDPQGCPVHHVLDPRTARPLDRTAGGDVVQVTVAAASATWAEALATAALVDGTVAAGGWLDELGAGALGVTADGRFDANTSWRRLRVGSPSDRREVS